MVFWDDFETIGRLGIPPENPVDELRRMAAEADAPSAELLAAVKDAVKGLRNTRPYRVQDRLRSKGLDVEISQVAAALLEISQHEGRV